MNIEKLLSKQIPSTPSWQRWIRQSALLLSLMLVLIGSGAGVTSVALSNVEGPDSKTADDPSLHNPTLDNHDWYQFHERYQGAYPVGVWLPDDDDNQDNDIPNDIRQDWRLWFQDGTDLLKADPIEYDDPGDDPALKPFVHSQPSAVNMRTFNDIGHFLGGLYQPIYNTTPCFTYEFTMYVHSQIKEADDRTTALQVGIDQTGWHPNSKTDPAVHEFPDSMVWGAPTTQSGGFVPLTVQAEAAGNKITVFTYADVTGGISHKIYWDTGSLRQVSPDSIVDPENPPAPSLYPQTSGVGRTAATIEWMTSAEAMSQVYYRVRSTPSDPPSTITVAHIIYLPLVRSSRQESWQSTALDTTMTTHHITPLTGLHPDTTYEYFVASRGLAGTECATWVSAPRTFTTQP